MTSSSERSDTYTLARRQVARLKVSLETTPDRDAPNVIEVEISDDEGVADFKLSPEQASELSQWLSKAVDDATR